MCSSHQSVLHLYPNNQLVPKNTGSRQPASIPTHGLSNVVQMTEKYAFPCADNGYTHGHLLRECIFSCSSSGSGRTKWCIFFLMHWCIIRNYTCKASHSKKRLYVLYWAESDYSDKVGNELKAVSRKKRNVTPTKSKSFSNEMFPPEIIFKEPFEWSINCSSN